MPSSLFWAYHGLVLLWFQTANTLKPQALTWAGRVYFWKKNLSHRWAPTIPTKVLFKKTDILNCVIQSVTEIISLSWLKKESSVETLSGHGNDCRIIIKGLTAHVVLLCMCISLFGYSTNGLLYLEALPSSHLSLLLGAGWQMGGISSHSPILNFMLLLFVQLSNLLKIFIWIY